jgi:general secretion pathway protein M
LNKLLRDARLRWALLAPREQQAVWLAAAAVGLLLLWFVGLQPAWRTFTQVPAQRETLETQWLQMQRMAGEARELKAQPPVAAAQSTEALKASTDRLGTKAKLLVQADRATLTLTGVSPEQLRSWLAEVRSGARARPIDLQLNRGADGLSGQVVVSLPASAG